ncbi:MAG: hypothetical protein GEU90_18810 [Gemmatimonas sp.]|nr:hypothetical protein [Gemmatimonas sp.]
MNRKITRRDFLSGLGAAAGGAFLGGSGIGGGAVREAYAAPLPDSHYPPLLTGMRGSHPGSFEAAHANLRAPRQFGAHKPTFQPDAPAIVGLQSPSGVLHHTTMVRELLGGTPMPPGMVLRDQLALVREAMLRTTFEDFERRIREQMLRVLGPGGFDPARDIQAITINRWPHGFAMGTNSLFDPAEWSGDYHPNTRARKPFGRITIANSDSAGLSLAQAAMGEGHRAVSELIPRNYGYFNAI